jgi:hypothetical protein
MILYRQRMNPFSSGCFTQYSMQEYRPRQYWSFDRYWVDGQFFLLSNGFDIDDGGENGDDSDVQQISLWNILRSWIRQTYRSSERYEADEKISSLLDLLDQHGDISFGFNNLECSMKIRPFIQDRLSRNETLRERMIGLMYGSMVACPYEFARKFPPTSIIASASHHWHSLVEQISQIYDVNSWTLKYQSSDMSSIDPLSFHILSIVVGGMGRKKHEEVLFL